ncbi:MAG: ECF transporter S component [Bacteroidales bacterium]|jgi:hypothetical protein|nr:ECF transporter S component [Bacteroidales bacterium]
MERTTVKLYSFSFGEIRTYLFASLFIIGNIVLPQLCHLLPHGGLIWLPIYFFTLIAAYKYGIGVGLLTAILSPVINSLFFGMPPIPSLPIILTKSILLAISGAYAAHRFGEISLLGIFLAVLAYQFVGLIVEWGITWNFFHAFRDIQIGYPGLLVQIFGGYLFLKLIAKR